jgi:hypothetical protein
MGSKEIIYPKQDFASANIQSKINPVVNNCLGKVGISAGVEKSVPLGVQINTFINLIFFFLRNRPSYNIRRERFSMGWIDHFSPLIQ